MNDAFTLIDQLVGFLEPMRVDWFVSGGWAIDIHLNRNTRKRGDLDISVPFSDRLACIEFFLDKGWRIEGKHGGGFQTVRAVSDYDDGIGYFWSFPEDVDFIGEYFDDNGKRRIAYNRDHQTALDYIEVFFDKIEAGQLIYRRNPGVKRRVEKAILSSARIRYLAPEVVLLFKSSDPTGKNSLDFEAAVGSLEGDCVNWLIAALSLVYDGTHPWLKKLKAGQYSVAKS